jgi:hypothetical protein
MSQLPRLIAGGGYGAARRGQRLRCAALARSVPYWSAFRWYDVAVGKFDGYEGIYGGQWTGPVFVLTHRPPGADHHQAVTFVSDDLRDAVATAAGAAAGKDVIVFGANLALQCLRAGLLDEIVIHLVPVLLGDGVRLIGTPNLSPVALERTLVATSGQVTDLRFAVRRRG